MRTILGLAIFLVPIWNVAAQNQEANTLRVYYERGIAVEQITNNGVTVMVTLVDTGKLYRLGLYAVNNTEKAVDIIPRQVRVRESTPKQRVLSSQSERDLQKIVDRHAFWGEVLSGLAAGLSRSQSTYVTNWSASTNTSFGSATTYGSAKSVVNTPDYEMQARWLATGDQFAASAWNTKLEIDRLILKRTTVFPGRRIGGMLWFKRDKALTSAIILVSVAGRNYMFPFPPPSDAEAPPVPGVPVPKIKQQEPASTSSAPTKNGTESSSGAQEGGGVLGVHTRNHEPGGVEIVAVDPNSSAEKAFLQVGDVITAVDGQPINTTSDLLDELSRRAPGTKVRLTFKTYHGYYEAEKVVTLGGRIEPSRSF